MEIECKRDRWGYIRLAARFIHGEFKIDSNVNFCIDTGSPDSYFMYEQAALLKIPINQLNKAGRTRIAGIEADTYGLEGGKLILRESTGKLHTIPFSPIFVLDPSIYKMPVYALLGDDFISHFTLVVESEAHGGKIYFTDQKVNILS